MKGLFFSQLRMEDKSFGTVKKVLDEISAFEKAGFTMRHINSRDVTTGLRKNSYMKGIIASLPYTFIYSKFNYTDDMNGYDFYYLRFEVSDYYYTGFLRKLRKNNPNAKIIIEFPDYPYIQAWKGVLFVGIRLKDYVARLKYKRYVDRFAVLNPNYSRIYGVSTINYSNGINVSRIPIRKPERIYSADDSIHMICVCTMFYFHGQERLINGMGQYYRTSDSVREIYLHLIGEGPGLELPKYKKLAENYGIEKYVIFEGKKTGDELDKYFDECDIAIGSLGLYKLGIECGSSLKIREYLSRGLPVVISGDIDIINEDFEYHRKFVNSEESIDINEIIDFYDRIYSVKSKEEVTNEIRQYAEKTCDSVIAMKNILSYLSEN